MSVVQKSREEFFFSLRHLKRIFAFSGRTENEIPFRIAINALLLPTPCRPNNRKKRCARRLGGTPLGGAFSGSRGG